MVTSRMSYICIALLTLCTSIHSHVTPRLPLSHSWSQIESLAERICGHTHQGVHLFRTILDETISRVNSTNVFNAFTEPDGTLRLDEATFLGTHNSYAHPPTYSIFYQHEQDIATQFAFGVRGFMLDTHMCDDTVKLAHRECSGPLACAMTGSFHPDLTDLSSVIATLNNLLDASPDSIIVISFEDYAGQQAIKDAIDTVPEFTQKLLTPGDWDLYEHDGRWPHLSWMREHNKRVVLFTTHSTTYAWNLWRDVKENAWQHTFSEEDGYFDHRPESNIRQDRTLYICNYNNMITADFETSRKHYSAPHARHMFTQAENRGVKDTPNIVFVDRSEAIMDMKITGRNDTLIDVINERNAQAATKSLTLNTCYEYVAS